MSLRACAEIVRKGDPDRFLATMAAPPAARAALFPIYALNVEVARAAWVSQEPAICEMRLQWWHDQLAALGQGRAPDGNEVLRALAGRLDTGSARLMQRLVEAREADLKQAPFGDAEALLAYLEATAGGLMWAAARALGLEQGEAPVRALGRVSGLANWFLAVPELVARGRRPLPDTREAAIGALARDGLQVLRRASGDIPKPARPATRTGWRARRTLRSAAANPAAVMGGLLHISEFSRRASLLWHVLSGAP